MGLTNKISKRKKKEERLYDPLKERLEQSGYTVYTNINLASYDYKKYWTKWHIEDIPTLQPQIDLLLVKKEDFSIRAIEVKYFEMKGKRIDKSYYDGIGEALALMNFGFESVALWHCFHKDVPPKQMQKYALRTLNLRETLSLRFDYGCLRFVEENGNFTFKTLTPPTFHYLYDDIPPILSVFTNPFKYQADAQRIMDFIRHVLRIPSK